MNATLTVACSLALCTLLPAQMEKRWVDRYAATAFARQEPAVGDVAPDLCLWDLDGRPRSLALERGRTIVLIGAAFT